MFPSESEFVYSLTVGALKTLFRSSKRPRKSRTRKLEKTVKLEKFQNEPVGIGGRPPKSIWINPHPLGSNGIHCVEFPHYMRKFLLNFTLGEPLALVEELPCFDNSINLDPLLSISLGMCVHNMITHFLLHAVRVDLYWCQLFFYL
jgi:hypothetical protein